MPIFSDTEDSWDAIDDDEHGDFDEFDEIPDDEFLFGGYDEDEWGDDE